MALGRFVAAQARRELARPVAVKAACCFLDALGLAVSARGQSTAAALRALASPAAAGRAAARIWPDDERVALSDAVAANAVAVHAFFQDDNDGPSWSHPASLVTPVAVSLGESLGAPLVGVLRAMAVGYGAMAWLGAKERVARALIHRGLRTSPTLGTVGAAAAAAAILQLDEAQATHAVGIAAGITGGVLEPVRCGSDEWRVQNGHAARGGLLAAQLAVRGVQGAPAALEGPMGLMRSLAGLDEVPEWRAPPTVDAMLGTWAKPWATLGDNLPAVAAAKALRDAGAQADRIVGIRLRVWRHYAEYPGTSHRGPFDTAAQAIASTAFGVAAMLAHGELDYGMSLARRTDAEILRLARLVAIEPHDGDANDATAELRLDDGSTMSRTAADAPASLFHHDEPGATALLEARLNAAGWPRGAGARVAALAFAAAHGRSDASAGELLDLLSSSRRGGA